METKFFKCQRCGNEVIIIDPKCSGLACCGQPMTELKANTSDGAQEKHVPSVTVDGDLLFVQVGSTAHPMDADHYIEWIYVETSNGGLRVNLKPGEAPKAQFALSGAKAVAVYAYCNKHGLWAVKL